MRQYRLSILLMLPIVLMLLLMPIIPHHHHGGEMCIAMEYCLHDHATNDVHTHHHGDGTTCMAENGVVVDCNHSASCKQKAKQIFLLSAFVCSILMADRNDDVGFTPYKPSSGYKPVAIYPHFSQKAPPVL